MNEHLVAHVLGGVVVNLSVSDGPINPEWAELVLAHLDHVIDVTALDPQPQIGWSYDGSTFTPPPAPEEPLD